MRRVTADSNIYISALQFRGKPLEFLNQARNGQFELAISDTILAEFTRILRDKFKWSEDRLRDLREEVATFTVRVEPKMTLDVVPDDVDDNRIIECAVESGSEVIVTHDKDLLRMKEYQRIRIR